MSIAKIFGLIALTWVIAASAFASSELDRKYALESIGFLRSWDNMDGLFSDYVAEAYKDFFANQSRFILQDLSKTDTVLSHSKIAYGKLIDDSKILSQIGKATRIQSIIRTKVYKEGPQYRFTLDWIQTPQADLIATEKFTIQESRTQGAPGLGDVKSAMEAGLSRLLAQVPFVAHITGRDNNSVTINVGVNANIHAGDTLVVSTLDDVKRHPLLKTIVDWRMSRIGTVIVDSVDDQISFGHVDEEESNRKIARFQKITQVIVKPDVVKVENGNIVEHPEGGDKPRTGFVDAGLYLGNASRDYGASDTTGFSGGGMLLGGHAQAQIWINRPMFADLKFGYGFWSNSQKDLATQTASPGGSVGASLSTFSIDAAYSFLAGEDYFTQRGWVKVGYRSHSYSLPTNATENTTPISIKGIFVGVGGDLPIRGQYGALLDLGFGLFDSATQEGLSPGAVNTATDFSLEVGGYYRYSPRMTFRVLIDLEGQSVQFSSGTSCSQKMTAISPSILYYF